MAESVKSVTQPTYEPLLVYAIRCGRNPEDVLQKPIDFPPHVPIQIDTHAGALKRYLSQINRGQFGLAAHAINALLPHLDEVGTTQMVEAFDTAVARFDPPPDVSLHLGERALTNAP